MDRKENLIKVIVPAGTEVLLQIGEKVFIISEAGMQNQNIDVRESSQQIIEKANKYFKLWKIDGMDQDVIMLRKTILACLKDLIDIEAPEKEFLKKLREISGKDEAGINQVFCCSKHTIRRLINDLSLDLGFRTMNTSSSHEKLLRFRKLVNALVQRIEEQDIV
jgi:hypothetical protein